MLLDITTTDFYLKRLIGTLMAYPDLYSNLHDDVRSYSADKFSFRTTTIEGATFLAGSGAAGEVLDIPLTTLPVPLTYTLTYKSPTSLSGKVHETGVTRHIPADVTDTYLRPRYGDNTPLFPFSGAFRLAQPWVEGSRITIKVEPPGFPYAAWLERFRGDQTFHRKLVRYEMVDEFHSNPDVVEKSAIAVLLMALDNPAVYG